MKWREDLSTWLMKRKRRGGKFCPRNKWVRVGKTVHWKKMALDDIYSCWLVVAETKEMKHKKQRKRTSFDTAKFQCKIFFFFSLLSILTESPLLLLSHFLFFSFPLIYFSFFFTLSYLSCFYKFPFPLNFSPSLNCSWYFLFFFSAGSIHILNFIHSILVLSNFNFDFKYCLFIIPRTIFHTNYLFQFIFIILFFILCVHLSTVFNHTLLRHFADAAKLMFVDG